MTFMLPYTVQMLPFSNITFEEILFTISLPIEVMGHSVIISGVKWKKFPTKETK
jgi:hypothetical protein